MAYCTQDDVQVAVGGLAKLAQLSDQDGLLGGAVDANTVAKAIQHADSAIDSYTGHRFGVPMSPVPFVVASMSAQWAARLLRRWQQGNNGMPLQDDIDQEKTDRAWLKGVGDGTISLGQEPTPGPASTITDKTGERDPSLIVSRRRLRGFA